MPVQPMRRGQQTVNLWFRLCRFDSCYWYVDQTILAPVMGHPRYFVGDDGYIYSVKSGQLRRLRYQFNTDGYAQVTLSTNGHMHTIKVQRLVASHFLGPRPRDMVVCHGPGGILDNSVRNLRYDTQCENIADIKRFGNPAPPRGSLNGQARVTEALVIEMRRLYATGQTVAELVARYGLSPRQTRDIVKRKAWKHV